MRPKISEFSYGFAITSELVRLQDLSRQLRYSLLYSKKGSKEVAGT